MSPDKEAVIPEADSPGGTPAGGTLDWLDELEELYRLSPVALCAVDRELRYVRANAAFARIAGCEVEQMIGRKMDEVNSRRESLAAMAVGKRVIESGKAIREVEIRGPDYDDPERTWIFLMNVRPVKRDGRVTGAIAAIQDVTAVRLAGEEALERLRELESVYRNAPVGLAFVDPELRYLRVNQQLADLNGVTVEQMVGRTYREMSPETADLAEPVLKRLMARGEPVRNLEVRTSPPADPGNAHSFLISMDPVRGRGDEVVGHVSAVQDLTALRRAEESAARRLEELEALYASAPVGLCSMDLDLRIVHLNPLFAQLSERPMEAQVGALASDVLPETIARQLLPALLYVAHTGLSSGESQIRARLRRFGEREYTWISNTHAVRSRDGEVTGIITVLQDVTWLAERQREIETVRKRLDEAQQVARVGSWEWDLLEDKVWWSLEMYELFGEGPRYEPTYLGIFEHVHPADRPKVRRQWDRVLVEDGPARVAYRIVRGDGTERLILSTGQLERTEDGIPARMIGTCQDVSKGAVAREASRSPGRSRRSFSQS